MHAYEYFLHYYVLIEEEQKKKKGMREREREGLVMMVWLFI